MGSWLTMRLLYLLPLLVLQIFIPGQVEAQSARPQTNYTVTADSVTVDHAGTYSFKGNATIALKDGNRELQITGDQATSGRGEKTIRVSGSVVIQSLSFNASGQNLLLVINQKHLELSGNVQITTGRMKATADRIVLDIRSGKAMFIGHVEMYRPGNETPTVVGRRIHYHPDSNRILVIDNSMTVRKTDI